MAKTQQKSQSFWAKIPKFVYGAIIGTILGTIVVMTLDSGAYVILAALAIVAAYTFFMTNPSFGRRFNTLSRPLAPAPVLGALVIGAMAFSGAYYLNESFAWQPQGVINKTVQNVTTKGPVVDANTSTAALSVKPGDILNYTITISNIAPAAARQYNDMAFTVLNDTLPAGLELVSNPGQRTITENIGTLLPGKSVVKIYPVKVVSTSNNAIIENKACFTADSVVRDNKQSGCDLAFIKVQVPVVVTPPATPPTPTPPPVDPKTNDPKYWCPNGTKTDFSGNVMTYNAPANAVKVIVKGGTGYIVYTNPPFTNLTAPINPNNGKPYAISHVIICTGAVNPTPPTPTPPTPTPPTPTTPTPTPPGTPPTPPTTTVTPPAQTPPTTTVSLPTQLPNVGPGNIITVALFAVLTGYIFHALYWYVKNGSGAKRAAR